ncbi:hypothetical protein OUZ56_020388 [Daphnia magna]|uniref:Uncharacterized protein n=1 Tax=Daphnia magna TaxID=35525 RepID=A0ABQ9ZFU9_9CRUS|nr:hypothetical protein OUZ56_020388 [Daphnia magna]
MSEADDDCDFDENADPNTSHVSQSTNSNPVKKLAIPDEFFTWVGDVPGKNASVYRCLHPGCVPKKKKDGSDKSLVSMYYTSVPVKFLFQFYNLLPAFVRQLDEIYMNGANCEKNDFEFDRKNFDRDQTQLFEFDRKINSSSFEFNRDQTQKIDRTARLTSSNT